MKLRNIGFAILSVCVLSLTSCKDEQKTETAPAETSQEQTSNTSGTTAALNPAHGQPGHRCDIPVGAPLDQAAATNTTQQQQQNTSSSNVSPVRVNGSSASATPTKNPPHGQPGHDCAVPVGADLPQS